MTTETTTVDLNDFGQWDLSQKPGVEPVQNSITQRTDLSYLDDQPVDKGSVIVDPVPTEQVAETIVNTEDATQIIDSLTEPVTEQLVENEPQKRGKDAWTAFLKTNIESGKYLNYNDYNEGDDLDAYLSKLPLEDQIALHNDNLERIERAAEAKGPEEFIRSLDPNLQAAIYYSQMGQDPVPYIQARYQLDDIKNANLEEESVQEYIVKQHLTNAQFGTPEDIDAEIQSIKDLGRLEDKAKKFHPQLVKLDEQRVQKLEQQAQYEQQQRELQYQNYTQGVHKALETGEIAGIKLDRKTQESLYVGMIEPRYPDRNGNPTTELGSLLDKYQYTAPDYAILAEVTLMLRNPEEYREKIRQQGANKNTEQVVRQLKTEQSRQLQPQEETPVASNQRPGIPRKNGFFTRPNK